jgi:hypothetical protein
MASPGFNTRRDANRLQQAGSIASIKAWRDCRVVRKYQFNDI